MEEKERCELLNDNCIYDNKLKEYVFSPNSSREDYMKILTNMLNKQDQNLKELAIEELEKLKEEMILNGSNYCEIRQGTSPHNPVDYYAWFNYVLFRKFIDNQIKGLKGEGKDE